MRSATTFVNWVANLDDSNQRRVENRLRQEKELVYDDMSLDQALRMRVKFGKGDHSLGWIARNFPARLELMMDTMAPGSPLFYAVTLVYNANLPDVLKAAQENNSRIRDLGIEGLREYKKPLKARPLSSRHEPSARRRIYLNNEVCG